LGLIDEMKQQKKGGHMEAAVTLPKPKPLQELIIDATCLYYGLTREQLFSKCRQQTLVDKRHICFYLIKRETNLSDYLVAQSLKFSRSSIQNAVEKVDGEKDIYKQVAGEINDILAIVASMKKKQSEWALQESSLTY
jgi:chromosomal replication initiation ATPase DnaA